MSSELDKPAAQGETPRTDAVMKAAFQGDGAALVQRQAEALYHHACTIERELAQMAKRVIELEAKIEELSITHDDLRVGYAEKLHPEVAAMVRAMAVNYLAKRDDLIDLAHLAAEKAREEGRFALVVARDYLMWLVEFEGIKRGAVNIVREALEDAIRRGKP